MHPNVAGQSIVFSVAVFDWVTETAVTDIPSWSVYYSRKPGGGVIALSTAMEHLGSGLYRGAFTPSVGSSGDHHIWIQGTSPSTGRTYNAVGSWRVVSTSITPPYQPSVEVEILWAVVDVDNAPVATAPTITESDDPDGDSLSVAITATATVGAYLVTFTPSEGGNHSGVGVAATTPPRGFGFDIDVTDITITVDDTLGATITQVRTGDEELNTIRRGDTAIWTWTIQKENGTAFNLTGCRLWFTAKARQSDADADAVISHEWEHLGSSDGISVSDPVSGIITHTITASESDVLTYASLHYDIQIRNATGTVKTLYSGQITIEKDTTRRITVP